MKQDILLLDFCGTVVPFQTFDMFIEYVLSKENVLSGSRRDEVMKKSILYAQRIVGRLRSDKFLYKNYLVKKTNGIALHSMKNYAQKYFEEIIQPKELHCTKDLIKLYKSRGYRIILLSAACDLYLKYYADTIGARDIISTSIEFRDGLSVGKIAGKDCIGFQKVVRFKDFLDANKIEVGDIVGITDSVSDLPMLEICKRKIVVSSKKHQLWVDSNIEEIIYEI